MCQKTVGEGWGGQLRTPVWPVHLRGAEAIGQTFGVHRRTVVQWRRQGAPIARAGGVYMAEYTMLMQWLVRVSAPGGEEGTTCALPGGERAGAEPCGRSPG